MSLEEELRCVILDLTTECKELRQQLSAAQAEIEGFKATRATWDRLHQEQLATQALQIKELRDVLYHIAYLKSEPKTDWQLAKEALSKPYDESALRKYVEQEVVRLLQSRPTGIIGVMDCSTIGEV